ncbi:hypothetical protein ACSNOF_25345, partial [Streptomyces sp. URMC 125]
MRRSRSVPRLSVPPSPRAAGPARTGVRTAAGALLLAALGGCMTVGSSGGADGDRPQPAGHQASRGPDGTRPGGAVAPRGGTGGRDGGGEHRAKDREDRGSEKPGRPAASSSPPVLRT